MSDRTRIKNRRVTERRRPFGHKIPAPLRIAVGLLMVVAAYFVTRSYVVGDPTVLAGPTEELLGSWSTDDARYRDRGFEVRLDALNMQVGPDDVRGYPLRKVRGIPVEGGTRYQLTYLTEDGEVEHRMTIDAQGQGRLERPSDVVWTRRDG